MRSCLRRSHTNLAGRQHAVDLEKRHVGDAQAGLDREGDEVGQVLAGPFVVRCLAVCEMAQALEAAPAAMESDHPRIGLFPIRLQQPWPHPT